MANKSRTIDRLRTYFEKTTSAAPLVVFRMLFGLLMLISLVRFAALGWIEKLYLLPDFHFSFYGFSWVKPIGDATYVLFMLCGLAAIGVMLGYRYRLSIILFFLSFTYIELMDKTTYLNHYYLVSVLSFLLIWLPAASYFSLDAWRRPERATRHVPIWTIDAIKLMLTIVYFYAGLAKLNSDWLLEAQPLATWLTTKDSIPIIGKLLTQEWMAYAFSWSGALYDLTIPFLLWYRPTRPYAFGVVVVFHVLTRILFPIGMFPYVMIVSTLIFFGPEVHEKLLAMLRRVVEKVERINMFRADLPASKLALQAGPQRRREGEKMGRTRIFRAETQERREEEGDFVEKKEKNPSAPLRLCARFTLPNRFGKGTFSSLRKKLTISVLAAFFVLQLALPFRYLLYPGELFWTEEGFRFSWRVMLMEKAGYAQFKIVDAEQGRQFYVDNSEFLNPFQEKQMAFQPDFILEYAHYLADHYRAQGMTDPQVYVVESYVGLNGRSSQPFVDPQVDLAKVEISLRHKKWLLPFGDEIKGL